MAVSNILLFYFSSSLFSSDDIDGTQRVYEQREIELIVFFIGGHRQSEFSSNTNQVRGVDRNILRYCTTRLEFEILM